MVELLPTRQKRLEKPQDDTIQWTLSNHHCKKQKHIPEFPPKKHTQHIDYEAECATLFISLLDSVIPVRITNTRNHCRNA
jgi:hypothetical protein